MASACVEVTLSVVFDSVEVRFSVLASGAGENSAAAVSPTAAAAEKQQAADEGKAASKDGEKTDSICIDLAALAEEYTVLCAELQTTCEALSPSLPVCAKPKVDILSDVKLKTIGPCIEGSSENLEALVKGICRDIPEEKEYIRVAVKNIIFQEANRKSYTHEKQRLKTANVMDDGQASLLWRWEVKKPSCLGEHKTAALEVRSWLKKAQAYLVAHHQAIKLFRGKAHPTLQQRQEAAYKKALAHEHPGAPPVAVETAPSALPDDDLQWQRAAARHTAQLLQVVAADSTEDGERPKPLRNEKQAKGVTEESKGGDDAKRGSPIEACADDTVDVKPSSATDGDVEMLDTPEPSQKKIETKQSASGSPQKPGRKSAGKDDNAAAAALGFGKKRSLEKSRGMMEMFVRRAAPKTKPSQKPPIEEEEKPDVPENTEMQTVDVLEGVKHISEALQSGDDVDVKADWKTLLGGRWKSLGESMKSAHVPGLPPPFARKAHAPRDPAKLAAMVLQSSDWKGVRTWRRKLFHFPSDGNRPPFYGSFSRRSQIVGARKVFRKDPNLDYEIMSDEEWEEEPEGEDIIDNDADDDEGGMDEEEEEDGSFMVADGYLSDDERAVDGEDSEGEDGLSALYAADAAAPLAKEQFLQSALSDSVTNYLNALLNAKNNNQLVIVSSEPGSAVSVQGQKVRGPDLLEALSLHVVGEGCVRPYEMGKEQPATQHVTNKQVDAGTVTAAADTKREEGALQPTVLQSISAANTAVNTPTATTTGQKGSSGLAGKPSFALNEPSAVQQPVVKKRRRIQVIPEAEPDSKKTSAVRACDLLAVKRPATAAPEGPPATSSAPDLPCTAPTTHCSDAPAAAETMHASPSDPTAGPVRAPPECPQPGMGNGDIGRWMDANPDRPRLPGGIGGETILPHAGHSWLSPPRSGMQEDALPTTPSAVHALAGHASPMKSPCTSSKNLISRQCGADQVLKDLSNVACPPRESAFHDAASPPCTPKAPALHARLGKSVLDSSMCRLQLNSKGSAPEGPRKEPISLCGAPLGDDEDANLQAALLASMHEPSSCAEPSSVASPGEENRQASEVLEVQNHVAHSHIPDAQRLAVIDTSGTDLQHEREQMFGEVASHLKECSHKPLHEFTSWQALSTYITLLASRKRIPPQSQMQSLLLKIHKWIDVNSSRIPEVFKGSWEPFDVQNKEQQNLHVHVHSPQFGTDVSWGLCRGLLRTVHRRLSRSLVDIEDAASSGAPTDHTKRILTISSQLLCYLSWAVEVPGHAGAQLASLLTGSGLQLPGSSFLNVLARLVEATACLEKNADADIDDKLPNDIVSLSYKILQVILQHASEPGASISVKLAPKDAERMFVSMIKDAFSSSRAAKRRARAVECVHGLLSVSAESLQKARAADFLAALGQCSTVPAEGAKSRVTIVLKKLLKSAFGGPTSLAERVPLATALLNLFHRLVSLADQHKLLASAAWQALVAPFDVPGGMQTTLTSTSASSRLKKIGQKVDEYKTKVSEQNVQKDIEYFVLMETAFKRLEQLTEAQKGKLDAPFLLQEKQPAPPVSMPKGELPFARPRLPSLKPGVAGVRPRDSEGEEGAGGAFKVVRKIDPVMVQPPNQSKGAKMLRMAARQ